MSVPAYGQCATQDRYCCSLLTDECFVVSEERFFHVRHHQGRLQRANLLTGKYLVDKEAVVKTILCMHLTTCMLAQSFFTFIQVSVTFTDHSVIACVRRFAVKKWRASRSARTPPWWTDVRVAPQGVNCQHFSIEMSALGIGRAARATPTRLGSRGRYAPVGRKHAAGIGSGSGQTSVRLPRYHHKQRSAWCACLLGCGGRSGSMVGCQPLPLPPPPLLLLLLLVLPTPKARGIWALASRYTYYLILLRVATLKLRFVPLLLGSLQMLYFRSNFTTPPPPALYLLRTSFMSLFIFTRYILLSWW